MMTAPRPPPALWSHCFRQGQEVLLLLLRRRIALGISR